MVESARTAVAVESYKPKTVYVGIATESIMVEETEIKHENSKNDDDEYDLVRATKSGE